MSDALLTLAKVSPDPAAAPSRFLVQRWLPNGEPNSGFTLQRLKEKCGDRSNASSEVEYFEAWGVLLGREGAGVKCIIDMVEDTHLYCALG